MTDPTLPVFETARVLRLARGGRLQPWLGPALRGLAGGRLKAAACRQPVADQVTRWRTCGGCPLAGGCPYGETVEGGPAGGDAPRPIVIAPAYPCPEVGRPGDRIPVRVLFVGPAAAHAGAFWEAVRVGGADPGLGLGEDRVLFDVLPGPQPDRADEVRVPADPAAVPGLVPVVRVVLTAPLVLTPRGSDGARRLVGRPTLGNLLARWDGLAELFAAYGTPLPAGSAERVRELAERVPAGRSDFGPVRQVKMSHRSGDRWEVVGVVGWGEYGPVPVGLLAWLRAAGRLHVGTHRVAGAGGWLVETPAG